MGTTGSEMHAREAARLAALVVLPTPPLPKVTRTIRGVGLDNSGVVRPLWWHAEMM
jgi:hypothetical protein